MDNANIVLATNIYEYRKRNGLTQEELAEKLGVTFQAVSKWENAKSAPDIIFLPMMAELFNCSIDELFSRETKIINQPCTEFPWNDDDIIRGVVCLGRKILQVTDDIIEKFTFEIIGDTKSVQSECNISVSGSVSDGCAANGEVAIGGHLSGGCNAGEINIGGDLSGGCCAGEKIEVGGNLSGNCECGLLITCKGNLTGDISSNGVVTVGGDVEADKIEGNVVCNSLKCDKVEGDVSINK